MKLKMVKKNIKDVFSLNKQTVLLLTCTYFILYSSRANEDSKTHKQTVLNSTFSVPYFRKKKVELG